MPWLEKPPLLSRNPLPPWRILPRASSNVILPPLVKIMPSSFNHWLDSNLPNALHLLGILVVALVLNRLLRAVTNLVIKHASAPGPSAQLRDHQTRTLAAGLHGAGGNVV